MGDQKLKLGRCHEATTYTCSGGGVQGINWVNSALMQPICKHQCGCTYPACKDQPDDPAKGKFCSLCGPKYVPAWRARAPRHVAVSPSRVRAFLFSRSLSPMPLSSSRVGGAAGLGGG